MSTTQPSAPPPYNPSAPPGSNPVGLEHHQQGLPPPPYQPYPQQQYSSVPPQNQPPMGAYPPNTSMIYTQQPRTVYVYDHREQERRRNNAADDDCLLLALCDVLNLVLYQTQANARVRQKERGFISLEKYCGLQLLNKIDSNHFNVIIIITTAEVIRLSFESIDQRAGWLGHLQRHFGQEISFEGIVPHKQRLKAGEATLRFYKEKGFFSLTRKDSYRCTGKWNLKELPKYGAVEGGFAFQIAPGTNSGEPSIYYFATRNGTEIRQLFDSVCRAGEERQPEEPPQAAAPPEPEDVKSQPNIFKRAWRRMSRRRKRSQDSRTRTRSVPGLRRPGPFHRDRGEERKNGEAPAVARSLSEVQLDDVDGGAASPPPGYENFPVKSSGYENLPGKGADGYENLPVTPPEGYEVMSGQEPRITTPDGYEVMSPVDATKSMQRFTFAKRRSGKSEKEEGKNNETEENDASNVAKVTMHSVKPEGSGKSSLDEATASPGESRTETDQNDIAKAEQAEGKELENPVAPRSSEEKRKLSEKADVPVVIEEVSLSNSKDQEEKAETKRKASVENREEGSPPEVKAFSNGAVPTITTEDVKDTANADTDKSPSVATRRGFKHPPDLKIQNSAVDDEPHPYVNSPPNTADYVNLQGNQSARNKSNPATRMRSQTGAVTSRGGVSKSKLNPYAMYDSTDDSIYHSVESLMPSSYPGYQNVSYDPSRCRSFENISGHSYANVGGSPSYQNVSGLTVDRSYVNLPSRKQAGNLHYIQVAGTDSVGVGLSPLAFDPSTSTKAVKPASSDYTWIDEKKTSLLKKTAKMHSDARKENVRRSIPKK